MVKGQIRRIRIKEVLHVPSNFSMTFKDSIWKEDILNMKTITLSNLKVEVFNNSKNSLPNTFTLKLDTFKKLKKQVFHTWKAYNTLKKSLPHLPLTWKDYTTLWRNSLIFATLQTKSFPSKGFSLSMLYK
jgi:hypothetical protein